jgi:hypothetical protein
MPITVLAPLAFDRVTYTKNIGIMCYGRSVSVNPKSVLYGNIGGTDELDVMTEEFDP